MKVEHITKSKCRVIYKNKVRYFSHSAKIMEKILNVMTPDEKERTLTELFQCDETEDQKNERELKAGIAMGKEFFKIFDDQDIINIVCALSKLSKEAIGQIPFFSLSEMIGEILPFLLPSLTENGKE